MTSKVVPSPVIDDNPCWGGPEPNKHDLEYLLQVLGRVSDGSTQIVDDSDNNNNKVETSHAELINRAVDKLVIYQDDNYIAINKPADLRMDGPYRATLHKLLLYLYPPPSLLNKIKESNDDNTTLHKQLLQAIAPLSTHADVKDDPFRMVHQLDYATSGVLLVGKSKKSTAIACKSFEQRKTNKQYVAVITHHASSTSKQVSDVPLDSNFMNSLPILPTSSLDPWKDGSLEKKYRKKRKRDMNGGAFNGFMPIHSVFDKWRSVLIREKKEAEAAAAEKTVNESEQKANSKKKKKVNNLPPLPSPKVELSSQDIDELLSLGDSWKTVKSQCSNSNKQDWKDIIECLTKDYNEILAEHYAMKKKDDTVVQSDKGGKQDEEKVAVKQNSLPPLFRIESDDKDEFYICASIGECKDGRFQVVVDPTAIKSTDIAVSNPDPLPELKPSLTKCKVLWRGHMDANNQQIPVTKVLLKPWTGRRHQLRKVRVYRLNSCAQYDISLIWLLHLIFICLCLIAHCKLRTDKSYFSSLHLLKLCNAHSSRVHMSYVAGYPILGDVAYGGSSDSHINEESSIKERGDVCQRMCLHAHKLTIPLIGNEAKTFVAQDPFIVKAKEDDSEETLGIV